MAEQQHEQDQGFFSRTINGVNSGYNNYRNGRMAASVGKQLGKQIGKRAAVAAAEATSEFWIPVLIAAFVVVVILVVLFGGASGAKGGDLSNSPSPTPEPTTSPAPLPGTISYQDFLKLFSIKHCPSLSSDVYYNCTDASVYEKTFIYNILSIPLKSEKYKKLLTGDGQIRIYLRPPAQAGYTSGGAMYGNNVIQYWGYLQSGLNQKTIMVSTIHETGHILRNRNPYLNGTSSVSYPIKDLAKKDPQCYEMGSDGPYIKTYAYRSSAIGGGYFSESLAESIGMQTVCGPGITCSKGVGASKPITSWPTYCPNSYKWIKTNIYGGVDFFGLP